MKRNSTLFTIICLIVAGVVGYYVYAGQKKEEQFNKENALAVRKENALSAIRNTWTSYIYTEHSSYMYSKLGGIDAFEIPIRNNTDFLIDEVDVTVSYLKTTGAVFKDEKVSIFNIPPHSMKIGNAPSSPRGTSVNLKITEVVSRNLNLCYPGNNRDLVDPYKCN